MALTADQLERMGARLAPLFQELERAAINDIARRFAKTGRLTETAELMAEALRAKGFSPAAIQARVMQAIRADKLLQREIESATLAYKAELQKKINAMRAAIGEETPGAMEEAGNMAFRNDLSLWKADRLPTKGSAFGRLVEAMGKRASGELLNLTKTLAFRANTGATVAARQAFAHQMNVALTKVASGAYSYRQAVEEAVRELSKSGMRTVDYESGVSRQIDTAARNAVMTASAQLAGEITMQNVAETGVDYVEVSSHWGARTGEGHANHAGWQGKVYRVQGSDAEYANLEEATGYPSDPAGLCGYNCGHTFDPFWPGISEPTEWPPEPEPKEYGGRTYTYYQATQEQRRREREIRALKREESALEAAGYKDKAAVVKSRVRGLSAEYRDFSEAMEIRAKNERLRVCEGTGEIHRVSRKSRNNGNDDGLAASVVDFSSASNLANGDIRLTNMLRSCDAQQTADAVNEILNGYGFRDSKWSGKATVKSCTEMSEALGQKEWSCDITIREDNIGNLKTYVHENLHSRSASYFAADTYLRNMATEEGAVEYMSQQICERAGVAHGVSYVRQVDALKEVRSILFPRTSEYDFAKTVFDIAEDQRYPYIVNSVNRYRIENPNMRTAVRAKLNNALAALTGLKEGASSYG